MKVAYIFSTNNAHYILSQMIREIPGLKERVENLTQTPEMPKFQEQLAIMAERIDKMQPAAR